MSEPAFPGIAGEDGCGPYTYDYLPNGECAAILHNPGMSLLDYFAGQALAGLSANPGLVDDRAAKIAEWAYDNADAMMAEREKRCAVPTAKQLKASS